MYFVPVGAEIARCVAERARKQLLLFRPAASELMRRRPINKTHIYLTHAAGMYAKGSTRGVHFALGCFFLFRRKTQITRKLKRVCV